MRRILLVAVVAFFAIPRSSASRNVDSVIRLDKSLAEGEMLHAIVGRLENVDAISSAAISDSNRLGFLQIGQLDTLPHAASPVAYDPAASIILLAEQAPQLQREKPAITSLSGLVDWVAQGGKLIVSLGSSGPAMFAPGRPLAGLRIGECQEVIELRQAAPLEIYIGQETRESPARPSAANADAFSLPVARFRGRGGRVTAAIGEGADRVPLVSHVPYGFGEIVVVGFDLNHPSLLAWPGRGRLIAKLLDGDVGSPKRGATETTPVPAWSKGYSALDEQLADGLDQFPGTGPELFWWLFAAGTLYVAIIGPLDWYLIRRRPALTWATFTASVIGAGVVIWLTVHFVKPSERLVNRLDVIDALVPGEQQNSADAPRWTMRGRSWVAVYSPRSYAGGIGIDAAQDATWPSTGPFRPERQQSALPQSLFSSGEESSAIPAWSSRSLAQYWLGEEPLERSMSLRVEDGRPQGFVASPLDVPLENAVLLHGGMALALGTLRPGVNTLIDPRADWRSIEVLVTRRRIAQESETAESFDAGAIDLARIAEVATLYEVANAAAYTRLEPGSLKPLDVSRQLWLGRAILIGHADEKESGVTLSGIDEAKVDVVRRHIFWRFVIPTETAP